VWSNAEFLSLDGRLNEVDAIVLTSKGLLLIETKSRPGESRAINSGGSGGMAPASSTSTTRCAWRTSKRSDWPICWRISASSDPRGCRSSSR
jgi:hypothetical protein